VRHAVLRDHAAGAFPLPSAPEDLLEASGRRGSAPVLCGVSDDEGGVVAAETAASLSALLGAPLILVRVARPVTLHPFRSRETFDHRQAARLHDAREIVEAVCARCALGGLASVEVVAGEPAQRLAVLAARHRAWMLVVGAGRRGLRLRGPRLSRRLSEMARCPVLVVPPPPAPAAETRQDATP
jgi:nucleotide-binding universal stress UspA family protein